MNHLDDAVRHLLARDPARRGLMARDEPPPLDSAAQLLAAAGSLAEHGTAVAIVTGFCVVDAEIPAAETDGPPGSLFLAAALLDLGVQVTLVTDAYGAPLLEAGADHLGLDRKIICQMPFEDDDPESPARASNEPAFNERSDSWAHEFFGDGPGKELSHLIAIERAGPSHDGTSIAAQSPADSEAVREFEQVVPAASHNLCHNMRGVSINAHTAKTHRLFELAESHRPDLVTISVADGGNEIGSGALPWSFLRDALAAGGAAHVACRIATSHCILAGISDWAAYALTAQVCARRGAGGWFRSASVDQQRALVEHISRETAAVDGVTRRREATVDGLPLETYLQGLAGLRIALGLPP